MGRLLPLSNFSTWTHSANSKGMLNIIRVVLHKCWGDSPNHLFRPQYVCDLQV